MIKRYPHTGYLIYKSTVQDGNGDFVSSDTRVELKGRLELKSTKNIDYSAVFFCEKQDLPTFNLDECSFEFETKRFTIINIPLHQTHCEIWLE